MKLGYWLLFITIATVLLVAIAWVQSGGMKQHAMFSAATPEEAVQALMTRHSDSQFPAGLCFARSQQRVRIWHRSLAMWREATAACAPTLRCKARMSRPLHADQDQAMVRVRMIWSSAVGSLDDVRDLHVRRDGSVWRVVWPKPAVTAVPPQVVSVNYLRWDVIGRNTSQNWGAQEVDSPKVRITSMNAIRAPRTGGDSWRSRK